MPHNRFLKSIGITFLSLGFLLTVSTSAQPSEPVCLVELGRPAPPVTVSHYALAISALLACLIIPAGLVAKVSQLRREKENALQRERLRLEEMITQRTADLQAAKQKAERRLSDYRQFLEMTLHELRSPLASMSLGCDLIADHARRNELPSASILERIPRAISRMKVYLDNLATQTRVESSQCNVNRSGHSPRRLLNRALEQAEEMTPGRELILDAEALPESINVDPDLIHIALMNLLDNALKYSAVSTPVTISAVMKAGELLIRVMDQGTGIPADEQQKVFSKYIRGRQSETIPGSGIGLYIVRTIANLHQGELELLSSTSGEGTTMQMRLPL